MGFIANRLKSYALNRLKEASTWKALAGFVATIVGYQMTGGQLEAAGTAGAAVYALLSALMPDKMGNAPAAPAPVNAPCRKSYPEPVKNMLPEAEEKKWDGKISGQFP
jgi:hypothetical protein